MIKQLFIRTSFHIPVEVENGEIFQKEIGGLLVNKNILHWENKKTKGSQQTFLIH